MEGDSSFCGGWVRQAAPGARRQALIPLKRGASVHGGRISISLEYQIQLPAHPI